MANNWTSDQRFALEAQGNLLISASAGSGKTTVMIERVCNLICQGADVRRIVVMTFSRAGALEMREKLISELYKTIRAGGENVEHLKKQVELVNFANICTIDSFCADICKRYFEDIGLDPSISIADAELQTVLLNKAIDQTLEEYLSQNDAVVAEIIARFTAKRELKKLKDTLIRICNFLSVQVDPRDFLKTATDNIALPLDKIASTDYLLRHYRRLTRAYEEEIVLLKRQIEVYNIEKYYGKVIEIFLANLNLLQCAQSLAEFYTSVKNIVKVDRLPPKGKNFTLEQNEFSIKIKNFKADISDFFKELTLVFASLDDEIKNDEDAKRISKKLLEITETALENYALAKNEEQRLDFADLEHYALTILQNPTRREEIKQDIDYIFVDEYQDTNYLQEALIANITKGNNVFMVGDAKQAIYKFRFAEPKIFLDRHKQYSVSGGTNVSFNDNFRSDERILKFVNLIFNEVMNYEFGGIDYKNSAQLVAGAKYPIVSDEPSVELFFYKKESKIPLELPERYSVRNHPLVEEQFFVDGEYIGQKIDNIVGKLDIYDAKSKTIRKAKYSDIAIIMYRKKGANIINSLVKRGIPYYAIGFDKDKSYYELNVLINYLRIIDNFKQDIPLASVMQSPIGNFSDKDMLKVRYSTPKNNFWDAVNKYSGEKYLEDKIKNFKININKYRDIASYCDVFSLCKVILADTGYEGHLLGRGLGYIEVVNQFLNTIKNKDFAKELSGFLIFYDNELSFDIELPSATDDCVTFLSMHKSKGLEFPIVFIADADKGYSGRQDVDADVMLDTDFGFAIKNFEEENMVKSDTLRTRAFKLKSAADDRESLLRLMYVAMTRARNHLYICGAKPSIKEKEPQFLNDFAEWIHYASQRNITINSFFVDFFPEPRAEKNRPIKQENIVKNLSLHHIIQELDNYIYPEFDATITPSKVTASAILKSNEDDVYSYVPSLGDITASLGTNYHKLLEKLNYNLKEKSDITDQLVKLKESKVISTEDIEGVNVDILYNCINSEVFDIVRDATIVMQEQPFMLYLPANEVSNFQTSDKILVQGVIDLLCVKDGKVTIVDFKTTHLKKDDVVAKYTQQLELYALAASKILNLPITNKILYIINANTIIKL